ncbi:MAG: S8 family serine peptidase, partial [Lapillicoccus sp.]
MKRLVCTIAAAASVLGLATATLPAQASVGADSSAVTTYLVVLREAPAASYQGGTDGYSATAPAAGARFDNTSAAVSAYRAHLTAEQHGLLAQLGGPAELYSYTTALNGFAAALTAEQVKTLQVDSRILLVQPDSRVTVDGSRGAAQSAAAGPPSADPATTDLWGQVGGPEQAGRGVVVGVIDTGVWPDNPSLAGIPTTPEVRASRYPGFTGICQRGPGWTSSTCTSKVIAARFFARGFGEANVATSDYLSPRDGSGHGTSVAAIAVGNAGVDTRIGHQDFGHISGLAPGAALSVYKACWTAPDPSRDGCDVADTLRAIDQAVADGVDVINYSVGDAATDLADPVQLAFLNATVANVFVSAPAGNGGPGEGTVQHPAPWVMTTGANTREVFEGGVQLGSGPTLVGAMLSDRRVGPAPLIYGRDVAAGGVAAGRSALCYPGSLDATRVDGAIVVCDRGVTSRVSKSAAVAQAGGRAMVLANIAAGGVDADLHRVPTVHLTAVAAARVKAYLARAGSDATATIVPDATNHPLVPAVADFSGRGPTEASGGDLLKPDLTAPGVSVISAIAPPARSAQAGTEQLWDVESGTSIAAPHVAGVAAVVRAGHPSWSPAAVKSALMTTAQPLAGASNPLSRGAGELHPTAVLDPGLVYDTSAAQWAGLLRSPSAGDPSDVNAQSINARSINAASIAVGDLVSRRTV